MTTQRGYRTLSVAGFFLCLVTAALMLPAGVSAQAPQALTAVVLRDFPPQYRTAADGRPTGFAVDILNEIARIAGVEIVYLPVDDWQTAFEALKSGQADLIPNQGITAERREWFAFTTPVETFPVSLFVRTASEGFIHADDLSGKRVAVVALNVGVKLVKTLAGAEPVLFNDIQNALLALLAGDVDALIYPKPVLNKLAIQARLQDHITTIGDPLVEIRRAVSVRKSNRALLALLNPAIDRLLASDRYQEIYARWYGRPDPFWTPTRLLLAMGAVLAAVVVGMALWRYRSVQRLNRRLQQTVSQLQATDASLRESQAVLSESERNLKTFLDALPESALLMAPDGTVLSVNQTAAERLGRTPETLLGRKIYACLPAEVAESRRAQVEKVLASGAPVRFEDERQGRSVFNNITPILDDDGGIDRLAIIAVDVTTHKQLEKRLRQAHKMEAIGMIAGGVAHEFNNLLSIISGNTELVLEEVPPRSPHGEWLQDVLAASLRGRDIVRQLLEFSHKQAPSRAPLLLSAVIEAAGGFLRTAIPARIQWELTACEPCPAIVANATEMQQVLLNLVNNAVQAIGAARGQICIEVKAETLVRPTPFHDRELPAGPYLVLSVADDGCGIAPEQMDWVFDPFYTTRTVGEGAGLGLSVVHGIVSGHDGGIRIHSERGRGARFECYFPITDRAVEAENAVSDALVGGTEGILFVDDEPAIVKMTVRRLERLGYRVEGTTDPTEAIRLFERDPARFDLVITDLSMPRLTGEELIARLKSVRKEIPVVLCTGYNERLDADKAARMGADACLPKPNSRGDLARTLRRVLDADRSRTAERTPPR